MPPAPTATDRLRRLLALVPWVASHDGGVPIAEICERFETTPERLVADLETVMMVGVYPFTPDTLIDLWISEDHVSIRYADSFTRPLRLTTDEAVALITSARALLDAPVPGDLGVLDRALDKLAAVVGPEALASVDVALGRVDEAVYQALEHGRRARTQVEIDYFSPDHDARRTRRIEPARLWTADGSWYVAGWCHVAQDDRVFRLDRVADATTTDDPFTHAREQEPQGLAFDAADLPRITLEVQPAGVWHFEHVPTIERTTQADGSVRITCAVASMRWLSSLLLQLGPTARVVEDDDAVGAETLAARTATSVLARYRGASRPT